MDNANLDDNISLKEMIIPIVKQWKIVVSCIVITTLLATIYLFAIEKPTYESSISGTINIPESVDSKFGKFTFPSKNRLDYLNEVKSAEVLAKTIDALDLDISVEALRNNITIATNEDLIGFSFIVSSDSPDNANLQVTTLAKIYSEEIRIKYREFAISAYLNLNEMQNSQLTERLSSETDILLGLEEELSKISPVIILKKLVTSDPVLAAEVANRRGIDIADLTDEIMFEEVINQNYINIELVVITSRQTIQNIKAELKKIERLNVELLAEVEIMNEYKKNLDIDSIKYNEFDVLNTRLLLGEEGMYSSSPISRNKLQVLFVAFIAGLLLGIFISLFRSYWKNN